MHETPPRIVSLVPSLTETLFDLGRGAAVVGVSDWCVPALPAGERRPAVGGVRDPRRDAILALAPDLVLASVEENRREDVEALREAGIEVEVVDPHTVAEAAAMVRDLGPVLGCADAAARVAGEIVDAAARVRERVVGQAAIPVIYPIWREPWISVGPGAYAHDVIVAAGGRVIGLAGDGPYPTLDRRAAARAGSVLLLPDEPFDFHGDAGRELAEEIRSMGAREVSTVEVDGRLAAWYGSRSGRRLDALARILHPEGAPR